MKAERFQEVFPIFRQAVELPPDYHGEGHTIANRVNVLDLWRRMGDWLSETLAARN